LKHLFLKDEFKGCGLDLKNNTCEKPWVWSNLLLQKVSRTFALNIGVLPFALKRSVLLSYLFCRIADTVEDDESLEVEYKQDLLELFANIFREGSEGWFGAHQLFIERIPQHWKDSDNYDELLSYWSLWAFELHFNSSEKTVAFVGKWIVEMCEGMSKYAARVPLRIKDLDEIDDYCYYVAGTVGYMLCDLFFSHTSLIGFKRFEKMKSLANSFGLGLQLTNIIKDVKDDYARGVSFVPESLYVKYGVNPDNVLNEETRTQAQTVLRELGSKARQHLIDALEYTLLIPRLEPRIRLFCLWPLFLALATLAKVLEGELMFAEQNPKISRSEVTKILKKSAVWCWSDTASRKIFEKIDAPLRASLNL
jgi:farnesyl-diphosphate farnesyltransferase